MQATNFATNFLAGLTVPSEDPTAGKWRDADFPKAGWIAVNARDVGPTRTGPCQVCGAGVIRISFSLRHSTAPFEIEAGENCAASLTGKGDQVAVMRKDAAQQTLKERDAWFRGWQHHANSALKRANRAIFCIVKQAEGWEWQFYFSHVSLRSDRFFPTPHEAKEALLGVWRDHREAHSRTA